VKLLVDDEFAPDNVAYLSVPANTITKVLLITNAERTNIEAALLAAPDIKLEVAKPPVVSKFDYDVIILHNFDPKLMLPGYYTEIERVVKNGSSVIITAQENLADAKIKYLPVTILGQGNLSRNIINITTYFTDGIDFGINERFLRAKSQESNYYC